MTVIVQDDHLTAGAWAACGITAQVVRRPLMILCYIILLLEYSPQ